MERYAPNLNNLAQNLIVENDVLSLDTSLLDFAFTKDRVANSSVFD
jgi:hypothetical protein